MMTEELIVIHKRIDELRSSIDELSKSVSVLSSILIQKSGEVIEDLDLLEKARNREEGYVWDSKKKYWRRGSVTIGRDKITDV